MILSASATECERLVTDLLGYMSNAEKAGQLVIRRAPDPDDREAMDTLLAELRTGLLGTVRAPRDEQQADALQHRAHAETRLGIPLLFAGHARHGFETTLPSALAIAASWDPDSAEQAEAVVAQEADSAGLNWVCCLEPVLAPAAGATAAECWGQDAHLASVMLSARIRGLQGRRAGHAAPILACLDVSGLAGRQTTLQPANVSEAARIVTGAIASGALGSLRYGDLPADNRRALENATRPLSSPGGFDGIKLSAWRDIADQIGAHDVDVENDGIPAHLLIEALDEQRIDLAQVDDAVARVLRAKFRLGLFKAAFSMPHGSPSHALPTPVHNREAALELARRCPVLIRNDPALLPLGIDSGDILLVGPAASDRHLPMGEAGGVAASVIDGLEQLGIPHRYVPGLALRESGSRPGAMIAADKMAIGMANEAAKRSGTVILIAASDENGVFPAAERELLASLANTNERLVLVNLGPKPVVPFAAKRTVATILHAGELGTMSGHAIAEILAGEFAPCGRLPVDAISENGDQPAPLGHGLTYTDFALTDLAIEKGRDRIHAFVNLRNVGEQAGAQIVQLYLRAPRESGSDSSRRLADFQRLTINGGQTETLTFDIGRSEFGLHNADGSFRIEPGEYEIFVGLSRGRGQSVRVLLEPDFIRALETADLHGSRLPTAEGSLRSA